MSQSAGGQGLTGADISLAQDALGQNEAAIHNRYKQLGLGTPAGGTAASAAGSGTNLTYGGPSTMEQQDIGTIPTETGGAEGMAGALEGELFNPTEAAGLGQTGLLSELGQLAGLAGAGGSILGGLGSIIGK